MHAPRRAVNQAWLAQNVTSYSYLFDVLVNGYGSSIGATHFQEVRLNPHFNDLFSCMKAFESRSGALQYMWFRWQQPSQGSFQTPKPRVDIQQPRTNSLGRWPLCSTISMGLATLRMKYQILSAANHRVIRNLPG